ncbi:MAG: hypothetical protein AAF297_12365 [Planctomycetota bacterium]
MRCVAIVLAVGFMLGCIESVRVSPADSAWWRPGERADVVALDRKYLLLGIGGDIQLSDPDGWPTRAVESVALELQRVAEAAGWTEVDPWSVKPGSISLISINPPIAVTAMPAVPPDPLPVFFEYGSANAFQRHGEESLWVDELFQPVDFYTRGYGEVVSVRWLVASHVAFEDAKYLIVTDGHNGSGGFVVPIESSSGRIVAYHRELSWHPIDDGRIEFVLLE